LAPNLVERRAQHAHAERARERLVGAVGREEDAREAAVGLRGEQRPDRRVDDVVAHVDDPLADGRGAEACIEIRADGQWSSLSRARTKTATVVTSSSEPSVCGRRTTPRRAPLPR